MKVFFRVVIFVTSIYIPVSALGQVRLTQQRPVKAVTENLTLKDIQELESTGELVRIYRSDLGTYKVQGDNHFSGRVFQGFEDGLILEDGRKIKFRSNESIERIQDNKVSTIRRDWSSYTTELSSYLLERGALSKLQTRIIDHAEINVSFLKESDHIIVSDDIEGGGNFFELYDKNLRLINKYTPFQKGFNDGVAGSNKGSNSIVVAATTSGNVGNLKVALLNGVNGVVTRENTFSRPDFEIFKAYIFSSTVVLYGAKLNDKREILCLDSDLNLLWSADDPIPLYYKDIGVLSSVDGDKLFYITAILDPTGAIVFKVVCRGGDSGQKIWEKALVDIYGAYAHRRTYDKIYKGLYVTGFDIAPADYELSIVVGQLYVDRDKPDRAEYSDSKLLLFDNQGNVVVNKVGGEGESKVVRRNAKLKVINPNHVFIYE